MDLSIENEYILIFILAQHTDKRLTNFTKYESAPVHLPPGPTGKMRTHRGVKNCT